MELDYDKTIDKGKLVFKGKKYQQIISYIFILIILGFSIAFAYGIYENQLSNNPSKMDYFIAYFFPILILIFVVFICRIFLTRDKLKELNIFFNSKDMKNKIQITAKKLDWCEETISNNYFIFTTKPSLTHQKQTITLIFFPDNRLLFNSISYPNDYVGVSKFEENYQTFIEEYNKIDK